MTTTHRSWDFYWFALCLIANAILVNGCLPAAPVSNIQSADDWRQDTEFEFKILTETDFLKPGRKIAIAREAYISPPISHLYLLKDNASSKMESAKDLLDHVNISSPETALACTRFFTTPYVGWFLTGWRWLEVVPARAINEQYLFGQTNLLASMTEGSYQELDSKTRKNLRAFEHRTIAGVIRFEGVLMNEEWDKLQLESPKVAKTPDGYIVTRWLVPFSSIRGSGTSTIYLVEQEVTPEGHMKERVIEHKTLANITFVPWRFSFTKGFR